MRLSTLFGRTLREPPAEAEQRAHQLVLRAGLARALLAGGYALLPLGMRVVRRIEAIMHEEMARIGAQELRTPIIQSATAWEQTGRYEQYGPLMLRMNDRSGRPLIAAPTHEEAIAELARREIGSYRQMPALVYQIHTKYRDELRTRGGLIRMREFTMLDAYSLDADYDGLDRAYDRIAAAFERIFQRCGVRFVAVDAATGEMGGRAAREYMALAAAGEDTLVLCPGCGYAANLEVAVSTPPTGDRGSTTGEQVTSTGEGTDTPTPVGHVEPVATPGCTTIAGLAAFLGIPEAATAKAVFFDTPERGLVFAVIRGDLEVNESKLRSAAGVSGLAPATPEQIGAIGAVPGYASPVGLTGIYTIADRSIAAAGPLVAGANAVDYHLRNVVYGRDWSAAQVADIALAQEGDLCEQCGTPLKYERGIEIGHIFKLGTRYTAALGAVYLDQDGTSQPIVMGSYGIGLERLTHIIVDQHHDDLGIVWPSEVAPFDVHLVRLNPRNTGSESYELVRAAGDALEAELESAGLRVLYDDRDDSAGVKFNDADLLGLPIRLVISERLLAEQMIEIKPRAGAATRVARGDVIGTIRAMLQPGSHT